MKGRYVEKFDRTLHLWIHDVLYNNLHPAKQRIGKQRTRSDSEKAIPKGNTMSMVWSEQPAKKKEQQHDERNAF